MVVDSVEGVKDPMFFRHAIAIFTTAIIFIWQPLLRADEWNKKTVVTVDQEIQLPNTVLQPGTYVFRLLDSPSDRHIVQVLSKDENQVITTSLAIPNHRLQPRGESVFTFWEASPARFRRFARGLSG
jgi:hypothetical protein